MQYHYQAKDQLGHIRQGLVVAQTQAAAEALLGKNNLTILSLEVVKQDIWTRLWPFGKSVSSKDLVMFSRQLSTLIGAQVPVLQALRILFNQVESKFLKKIIIETVKSVESGDSLSLSLSRHPEVFGDVYISIVYAGELSGTLDKSLLYLADQLEKEYDLNTKVRGAMTYPIFVLGALVLVGAFMFLFILPKLTDILTQQGGSLPIITVMLINFTKFFGVYWWTLFIAALVVAGLLRYAISTIRGRYIFDRIKVSSPIIGPIFRKIYLARFARNFSTLILGGIPIVKALEIVSQSVNNVIYRDIIIEAGNRLIAGKNISDAFAGHKEIPPIVTQMIQVGEQSATLTSILLKLAVFYEKEVDTVIGSLTTLIEPIIILILGVAVGILVAGILLPIYNLANSVQ